MSKVKTNMLRAINDISSVDEMNQVIELISFKQKSLRHEAQLRIKSSVRAGDKVRVSGSKANGIGQIVEVKRTKAIVVINSERWNVPLTLIEKV
jgi:hypothetical protein|tara:strand:- start:112 stop:393 length:282 start_codon:yes stop_codon:yes gene_type:complete